MEYKTLIPLMVLVLLLGGLVTYVAFPQTVETEKVVTVEKVVEVPTEVLVEVPAVCEVQESDLNKALSEFLKEVEDDDDLLDCDGHEYDYDEVSVSKLYDEYTVAYDEDMTTVSFKVKLKFDEDDEKSCKRVFEPTVEFEEDEDPVVIV